MEVHDYRYNAGRSRDVHRSDDKGAHWSTASITFEIVDRPWIEHFGRKRVYVVAKGSFQFGVPYLWISNDGGRSFPNPPIPIVVYETGVVPREAGGTEPTPLDLVISGPGAYMDHMVVDPRTGDLYVLNGPPGLPLERHRAGWPRIRRLRLGGPATGRGNGVSVLVLRQTGGPRHGRGAPS